MYLAAPYHGPITIMQLPNPEWGNTESLDVEINHQLTMDGEQYTYVKSGEESGTRVINLQWNSLTREKQVELSYFLSAYSQHYIKLTDWNDDIWKVRLISEPISFNIDRRGYPMFEQATASVSFQGEKQ